VLNLEHSLAIAGNYIDSANLAASRVHLEMEVRAGYTSSAPLWEALRRVEALAPGGGEGEGGEWLERDLPWAEFKRGRQRGDDPHYRK
jgi:hypothetical protein